MPAAIKKPLYPLLPPLAKIVIKKRRERAGDTTLTWPGLKSCGDHGNFYLIFEALLSCTAPKMTLACGLISRVMILPPPRFQPVKYPIRRTR